MPNWVQQSRRAVRFMPLTRIALLVLVLALLSRLLYHHETDWACASCPLCHMGVQSPVATLVGALVIPRLNTVGRVDLAQPQAVARIHGVTLTIARAPPVRMPLVIF